MFDQEIEVVFPIAHLAFKQTDAYIYLRLVFIFGILDTSFSGNQTFLFPIPIFDRFLIGFVPPCFLVILPSVFLDRDIV